MRVNLDQLDGHVWPTEVARTAFVRVLRTHKLEGCLTTHEDDPHLGSREYVVCETSGAAGDDEAIR